MTIHKEVGICIAWDSIVTEVLRKYGVEFVRQDEIKRVANIMQDIEHRYIDIE